MCRHDSGSSVSADRAIAVGPAGPSTRRLRQSAQSPKASRPLPCSPTSWSPNTAITFRCTDRAKSSPGRALSWIARRSRTGSAAPAGGSSPFKPGSPNMSSPRKNCSPTTPRSRCSIPGRGRTKTGRLWVYARDDRPWSGPDPPAAIYLYSPDRKAERPVSHLIKFKGVVQVDGYPGFEQLGTDIRLAACWAHARRKFYEVHHATGSPIAAEALRRIAELYAIEANIRGQTATVQQNARQSRSLPLVGSMKLWLETQLTHIPPRSGLADAIRYALTRWDALCRFLDDGRIELDTNTVERAIRPITLGRKNHLFAGSDGGADRWATVCSLITTAKLNNVEPFAYLKDVLERMSNGHHMSQLDDLLPWNWRPETAVN